MWHLFAPVLVWSSHVPNFNTNTTFSLKVILSASPLLSLPDLQCLVEGMGQQDRDFLRLLQGGVTGLRGREEPKGHTVLILDKVHRHYSAWQLHYLSRVHILNILCFYSSCRGCLGRTSLVWSLVLSLVCPHYMQCLDTVIWKRCIPNPT